MKKRILSLPLIFILLMITFLPGCSSNQTLPEEQEPDTNLQTLNHPIGKRQEITYHFHTNRIDDSSSPYLYIVLLSDNVQDSEDASNRCEISVDYASMAITSHRSDIEKKDRWKSNYNSFEWIPEEYDAFFDNGDVAISFKRIGETLKATATINDVKTWTCTTNIKHFNEKTAYIRLSAENLSLSGIVYQDLGKPADLPLIPGFIVRAVLTIAVIAIIYILHVIAKLRDQDLFLMDTSLFGILITTGLFAGLMLLGLLIAGRSHPDLFSIILSFLFPVPISLPAPAGGPAFWIPAVICALVTAITLFFTLSEGDSTNHPIVRLLRGLLHGALHTLWYVTLAVIISETIGEIVSLIVIILFFIFLGSMGENSIIHFYDVYINGRHVGTAYSVEFKDDDTHSKT